MRLAVLALIALVFPFAAACGGGDGRGGSGGVRVVATTSQIGALVREVAGDDVDLTVLIKPGVEAHEFEPDPGAIRDVHDADLILRNGIGLDDFLEDIVGDDERVITVTEGVKLSKGGGGKGEDDPHVWHDVDNAKQMLANIAEALSEADPAHASDYDSRARDYAARLDEVDRQIRDLFAPIPQDNRKVVTNHDAFGYFIQRYGLDYAGTVFPSSGSGAQPSAAQIARLEDLIRAENVHAILTEEELDSRVAQQLASDTGVQVISGLYADSLGKPGSGADTVDGMLLSNARKIAEGLRE